MSQVSLAVGLAKTGTEPVTHSSVRSGEQVMTGGRVSRTVTERLRVTVLEQSSVAVQRWLMTQPQPAGAMPEMTVRVTLVPLHRS